MDKPTNIEPYMQEAFEAIASGEYTNFALFSCSLGGKPTAAIVAIHEGANGIGVNIQPLFVAVTPEIIDAFGLVDSEGVAPTRGGATVGAEAEPDWDQLFALLGNDTNN